MKTFPSIPRVADAPGELFEDGHLWLLEKIDGAHFRFQLQESGLVRFGDRNRVYDDPARVPDPYQHAVRHVRERLDRAALRAAVDDVEDVVFFGEATHHHTIDYDWDRIPSVLGFDVWSADRGEFLAPDAVEGVFERLNLHPVNAIERELPARDFDPERFTVPESAWYDGPAEGVVVRNKRGGRAKLLHPDFCEAAEPAPDDASAETIAAAFATDRRFEKLAAGLEDGGVAVTVDTLFERVFEDIVREEHRRLSHGEEPIDTETFRSELAALTREFVENRNRSR